MKIWCQLPSKVPRVQPFTIIYDLLEKNYNLVKRKDTEIAIKDVPTGFADPKWLAVSGLRFLNESEVLKSILAAEREGFDGVSIACFFDPALRQARQLLGIPVTGLAESSMHLACMMGAKFAVITSDVRYIPAMEEHISRYGVELQAIKRNPVRGLTISGEELFGCFGGEYTPVVENFKEIAIGCIEDGAEVLIAGCSLMSPLLTRAGIREVNGATIIDPLLVSLKLTEALVDLCKANIPIVSRKSFYSAVSRQDIEEACAALG